MLVTLSCHRLFYITFNGLDMLPDNELSHILQKKNKNGPFTFTLKLANSLQAYFMIQIQVTRIIQDDPYVEQTCAGTCCGDQLSRQC